MRYCTDAQTKDVIFGFVDNLIAVYAERFLRGVFAAAVTPVALAVVGDLATSGVARARRLTFVSLAGISGFLIGPVLGVAIARSASNIGSTAPPSGYWRPDCSWFRARRTSH